MIRPEPGPPQSNGLVIYLVAISIDGKIARAGGSFECFMAEGEHVTDYVESLKSVDEVLMDRNTCVVGRE